MIRTFDTHKVRFCEELTGKLWSFLPVQGEYAGQSFQVPTPVCIETLPKFRNYRGEGIFRTTFTAGGDIRIECKGVSHTAHVYLDGREIASHYNAYTAFDAVVKELEEKEHKLEIVSDNRFSKDSALHVPNDYMTYGGIVRPVVLEKIPDVYIRNIQVTPYTKQGKWNVKVELMLENIREEAREITAEVQIADERIVWENITLAGAEKRTLTQEVSFTNVREWSQKSPNLTWVTGRLFQRVEENSDTLHQWELQNRKTQQEQYEKQNFQDQQNRQEQQNRENRKSPQNAPYAGMVLIDDFIDRFGFREVTVSGKEIRMNGEKLRILGLCRHEDHPQFGCALPYAAMAADLEIMKDLGANSVRTSHYPNDEVFLDLCDEQGILVWEENHARGLSLEDMENPNFEPQAEAVIREMIPAHYNHPSIYIWGILNECASETEYGRKCYETQLNLIKELDQSRPHSFASCKFKTDICFDLPDVVSYNIYPLWYHDTPVDEYLDDLYQWVQNETGGKGKPFLISEIGAGAIYGYRAPHHPKWSEEYQAETLEKQLHAVLDYEGCSGVYIWQFCDIRISDEWALGRPRTMNNKGIVDEYRRPKLSYDIVKRIFAEG